jgi:hypothetical protein
MLSWVVYYKQGLRRLARHKPHLALKAFHAAVSACPVTRKSRLARILFYTGVTLKKMGVHDAAVRTWAISRKLIKSAQILRYMELFSNEYGMARQDFADMDDWRAFYAIHLKQYLCLKKSHRLETRVEADMIRDLIYDAWVVLKSSGCLDEMRTWEKMAAFEAVPITFPPADFVVGDNHPMRGMALLDFPCSCGSGKPFLSCCGRIEFSPRYLFGSF